MQVRGELCSQVVVICKELGISNEVLCDSVLLMDRALSTELEVGASGSFPWGGNMV